jgi:hypothetical protein
LFTRVVDIIDMSPYTARRAYVELADQLLREIPGPHLKAMATWPKWDKRKSPPVPGGHYPNPKWKPFSESPSGKTVKPPPPLEQAMLESYEVLDQSIVGVSKKKPLTVPKIKEQKTPEAASKEDSSDSATPPGGMLESEIAKINMGHVIVPSGTIEPSLHLGNNAGKSFDAPTIGSVQISVVAQAEDEVSTASDESSLDLNDVLAGITGIRPEAPAIGQGFGRSIGTTGGIAKHVAVMGGEVLFR